MAPQFTFLFFKSMLITTATILGVGVLTLPVKLNNCGLAPFLATYVVALVSQVMIICFVTELLQRTEQRMLAALEIEAEEASCALQIVSNNCDTDTSSTPLRKEVKARNQDTFEAHSLLRSASASPVVHPAAAECNPNLHAMGHHFIPHPTARLVFNFCVFIHFIIVLVAYVIGASNAVNVLFGFPKGQVIFWFTVSLSVMITVWDTVLTNYIALFTIFKGGLLVSVVGIAGYIAGRVQHDFTNDWGAWSEVVLIGTVSLGGSVNVLPVVYCSFKRSEATIREFRWGCIAGTVLCFVINVLWSAALLLIVPQHGNADTISLTRAFERHDISTTPLLETFRERYPEYVFVGGLVNIFIITSVSVSYVTLGLGMKHYLDGAVAKLVNGEDGREVNLVSYVICFSSIFALAYFFSKSLYLILDVFNSAFLNLETGVFMVYMQYTTRFRIQDKDNIAVQINSDTVVLFCCCVTMAYFGGAVLLDMFQVSMNVLLKGRLGE